MKRIDAVSKLPEREIYQLAGEVSWTPCKHVTAAMGKTNCIGFCPLCWLEYLNTETTESAPERQHYGLRRKKLRRLQHESVLE